MKPEDLQVPFLPKDIIRKAAEKVLSIHNPKLTIPVPAEEIIEINYQIQIIPSSTLKDVLGIDGLILSDFSRMYIDRKVYDNVETRYLFSITHEFGHRILHEDIVRDLCVFNNETEAWEIYDKIPPKEMYKLEQQANIFAGYFLMPEEPLQIAYEEWKHSLSAQGITVNETADGYMSIPLARKFNVSQEAMINRIKYMNSL